MSILDFLRREMVVERLMRFIHHIDLVPKWNDWFVGATDNPQRRLCDEHKASLDLSTIVPVASADIARSAVRYLINRYGVRGDPGSGDNTCFVYVFRKTADTNPPL